MDIENMLYDKNCRILPFVQKPARYIGVETNSLIKERNSIQLSVALAFPDVYEVGMSHLGLQILYSIINSVDGVVAERCYAPWGDMEQLMRRQGIMLLSRESQTPLRDFDVVGFSLQYELSYTNCLNMLELGGITIRANERREEEPIIIAGGPCAYNPLPMADFIGAFVVGEAEEAIIEIVHAVSRTKKLSRRKKLEALAKITGVYVPAEHQKTTRITKRLLPDFASHKFPLNHIVPSLRTVHDRVVVEIARGCTRGCRFCQAGFVWRPVRERSVSQSKKIACELLSATGIDELSLLSLSTGDHSQID
ncbi:MAG: hypothetical protein K9K75_04230 [Deltaproteobacteria bacterium]|nr:hypothetical protein [Deltaproteobacteria bacterium]